MRNNSLFLCAFLIFFLSCKKHLGDKPPTTSMPPPAASGRDSLLAGTTREIASVLEQVYRNDAAYAEVNAAIFCGYYLDERVLLKDLLHPETSDLYQTENFQKQKVTAGVFRKAFDEALAMERYPLLKQALAAETDGGYEARSSVLSNNLVTDDPNILSIAIYFPYSTDFHTVLPEEGGQKKISCATIVAADREADVAPGRAPYSCNSGKNGICFRDVVVDDNYADSIPTHIVEYGARPKGPGIEDVPVPPASQVTRVYLGRARLTRQMDALISLTGNGGGSEIKIARLSGYLKKEGEQVSSFSGDMVSVDFSRADIRRQSWKRIYSVWDPNWIKDNTEQVLAVYEDDTKGTKTFSGSLSTTVNLPGSPSSGKSSGEIGYKVEVSTQDDIITQRKLDRLSFFRDGMNNQGWGFVQDPNDFLYGNRDWPLFDGGTIWQYSMPWRIS